MSTEIKDTRCETDWLRIFPVRSGDEPEVSVTARDSDPGATAETIVSRADFLAAVATECDVIVIDRATLPEVTEKHVRGGTVLVLTNGDGTEWSVGSTPAHMAARVDEAYRNLALVEYAKAHPLVDEAQVETLAEVMRAVQNLNSIPEVTRDFARRLLATGRIEVRP